MYDFLLPSVSWGVGKVYVDKGLNGRVAFQNEITFEGWRKDLTNVYICDGISAKGEVTYEYTDDGDL